MAISEFGLIKRFFFSRQSYSNPATRLGIGDDCALLSTNTAEEIAVTTDTLVENIHFFAGCDARMLGHKALAVNLSDLAAMGAKPLWVTLALTLPNTNEDWLEAFSQGFLTLAESCQVELIGGDTTRGPLSITVQAIGKVPVGEALCRSSAQVGDAIYVTGFIGNAGLGLAIEQQQTTIHAPQAQSQLHQPHPRIKAGLALRRLAHAAIDLSDGLTADLNHILEASEVGATLNWDQLPLSSAVQQWVNETGNYLLPLQAGDDYELCFTLPVQHRHLIEQQADLLGHRITRIGEIESKLGLRLLKNKQIRPLSIQGYQHFTPNI